MEHIAFLGLGHMGAPMARRLLAAGHPLTVWNRTAGKAGPLVAAGAGLAASPAGAVRDADVVITMLAGPDALEAVAGAAAEALRPGGHWIEMSTVGPDAVHRLAARLPEGVPLVDAPWGSPRSSEAESGGGQHHKAASGALGILAGGDTTGVEHLLAHLGTVTRTGALGSGAALKLVLNSAVISGIAVVAEALRLADTLGLEGDTARTALANGPLAGVVVRAHAEGVHFDATLAVKDLDLATKTARLPVIEAASEHYRRVAEPGEDISRAAARIRTA
ncbi:NAD(P)-dependent oxidoreductase [Streptomyces sp. WM6386]|uniref:NAD(P)-dependent oxidoreductase n=1 Tax=Streptomyces sp. WM6386 TaxID=1415558 RepID=UPI000619B611|nr:NAD(P)-dependent oxidoreductase [Streptomyces sp. WM6386]KKD06946.1 6-phosphogluconate dehydrogenase [Streptomyces sp. WM6386]